MLSSNALFSDRERSYENKFAHDRELDFKISARTHKLFGLWAATLMHYPPNEAIAYSTKLIELGMQPNKDDWNVMSKVTHDLKRKGVMLDDEDILQRYEELRADAAEQIRTE